MLDAANKLPMQSKKFVAYLIAEIGWKALLGFMLWQMQSKFDQYSFVVVVTLICVSGFIQVGYIIGEVALDRYTRMATLPLKGKSNDQPEPK